MTPDRVNMYLWNITNLDDVRAGARPVLQEVGPYELRKWRIKEDVEFDREGRVSFSQFSWYTETDSHAPVGTLAAADGAHSLFVLLYILTQQLRKLDGTEPKFVGLAS